MQVGDLWTLRAATRVGLLAGFAALLIWPVHALTQAGLRTAFLATLVVTAFCGLSILSMTAIDLLTVRRDRSVLPARIFDLALGALLAIPAGAALTDLIG